MPPIFDCPIVNGAFVMTSILLADHHSLFRAGMVKLIDTIGGFTLAAEVDTAAAALDYRGAPLDWPLRCCHLHVARGRFVHPYRKGKWHHALAMMPARALPDCGTSYPSPLTTVQAAEPVFSTILTGLIMGKWAPWQVIHCGAVSHR